MSRVNRGPLEGLGMYLHEARACTVTFRTSGFREEIQLGSISHTSGPRDEISAADTADTFFPWGNMSNGDKVSVCFEIQENYDTEMNIFLFKEVLNIFYHSFYSQEVKTVRYLVR